MLRLDAIAFLWKRLGTNCQNQPEVHALTQALRTVARIACPALAFKAEAIVGPRDLVQYLGLGPHAGRVSDLAYHNSLMVQVWSMLATGNAVLARQALGRPAADPADRHVDHLRPLPRRHRLGDRRRRRRARSASTATRTAASSPTGTPGTFPGSWAHGLVFQHNPATGDRRISGTAASLTGLAGRRRARGRAPALARIFLAHAIVAGWGGIPVVWSGDELGLPNDPRWADEPGHEDDNRWAHRPRLDWAVAQRPRTTCAPSPAGCSRAWRTWPGSAPRCRSCTPAADSEVLHGHRRRGAGHGPPAPERADGLPLQRD